MNVKETKVSENVWKVSGQLESTAPLGAAARASFTCEVTGKNNKYALADYTINPPGAEKTALTTAKTGQAAAKPETPAAKPETPATNPETPSAKPETPAAKPETPAAKAPTLQGIFHAFY